MVHDMAEVFSCVALMTEHFLALNNYQQLFPYQIALAFVFE